MEEERKPWLMYFTGKGRMTQTFYNILDPTKSYSKRIPDHLLNSCLWLVTVQNGWYLMENIITKCVSDLFLWNPLNLKKIKLPRLRHNDKSFGHGNCILSITNDEQWSIFILSIDSPSMFYYQLGDKQWTKVRFYDDIVRILTMKGIIPLEEKKYFFCNSVYCNGVLYAEMWTPSSVIIVVIEKLQPNGFTINCTFDVMVQPQPDIICGFEQVISRLIGSNNVLFRIEVCHALDRVDAVFVYKCDCSQRVWEKVESIKDKLFFISNDSAFACQARNPETEGGRVYIALNNCNFVYIYKIEDKSLETFQHFSNLSNIRSFSRWFMPDTEMTGTFKKEIRKERQIGEEKGKCDVVYLKEDAGDNAHKEYALPVDMVETIAKYIDDVVDYLHFRASYKFLRLSAPPIQWRSSSSMSMSRFDDLSMCPLFVFSMKDKVFTFVHPKHGLEYKNMINFPEGEHWNSDSEICCSKDGWLLLVAVYQGFQVFFNPFTKEVLQFPFGNKEIWNIRCFGMSYSPTSSECVTVELHKNHAPTTMAYIHFLQEGECQRARCEHKSFPLFKYNISHAFHNGLIYFLSVKGKLSVIEVTRENIRWKLFEKIKAPCSRYFNSFLVECDGNLLSIFESPFAKGIQVFKLNENTMTWMKVTSLKNHMLFVGKTSFSVVANIPGMENKIYFNRFYGNNVVFYSLETNNYHTFENIDQVVNFHDVREQLNGTWIQPRWH